MGALRRPCSLRRRVRRRPFSPPRSKRGDGAPRGATLVPRLARRGRPLAKGARLSALHRGVLISAPGRAFRGRIAPACRQPAPGGGPLVPPGGAPAPPGCVGCVSHARRRRIRSTRHGATGSRPFAGSDALMITAPVRAGISFRSKFSVVCRRRHRQRDAASALSSRRSLCSGRRSRTRVRGRQWRMWPRSRRHTTKTPPASRRGFTRQRTTAVRSPS